MKSRLFIISALTMILSMVSCMQKEKTEEVKIIYLHHSTGEVIWNGAASSAKKAELPLLLSKHNKEHNTNYTIKELEFPKAEPYGWNNYPYDYYNIWVKNAGDVPFLEEPTLEMLTKDYKVIIFKHCFPVCNIQADQDLADISSELKTISNYKLQYVSLRDKLNEFPDTKFILFTGAALVKSAVTEDEAKRAREFFSWVINEWEIPGDNIFLWDLYSLQTEGGLYFKDEFAVSSKDSHPNKKFASKSVNLLFNRIIDVMVNNGNGTLQTGEFK